MYLFINKEKERFLERSRDDFFHPRVRLTNQNPPMFVYIRSLEQSDGSISVLLLFLFCSRVFISKSYENYSIWLGFVVIVFVVVFYTRVGIDKVEGMQKRTLF